LLTPSRERMARGWTRLTCWIGGRQTVQNYQHSPTCCVQCSLNHPTHAHLSVSLASSMQLSMTIRRSLTPTTYSYRYSHSLTNDRSSSRVPRSEGEGEEWVIGTGRLLAVCNHPWSYACGNPSPKRHMPSKESRFAVHNRLLIT